MISPSERPLPDNTQHSQQTNINAPGGIRTHDLSRRAGVDLRLRSCGYWDRHFVGLCCILYNGVTRCVATVSFLDSFSKQLQKVNLNLVMSSMEQATTPIRRIFLELHIWDFYENVYIDTDFIYNRTKVRHMWKSTNMYFSPWLDCISEKGFVPCEVQREAEES